MWLVPVMYVPVNLVPHPFAFHSGAVVKEQGSASEVTQPQYPRVLLVCMVPMPLTCYILLQSNLGFIVPPLGRNCLDGIVELWLLRPVVQHVGCHLRHFYSTLLAVAYNVLFLGYVGSEAVLVPPPFS